MLEPMLEPYRAESAWKQQFVGFTRGLEDDGGPGGRLKIVDCIEFFVGQKRKASHIVPYAPVTPFGPFQLSLRKFQSHASESAH